MDSRFATKDRARDYTPPGDRGALEDPRGRPAGGAPAYLRKLGQEILPRAETLAPLDPARRWLWGHSYGGLFVLQAALVNLLARSKPDRVIIEPSGLGHPAGLLDLLRGEAFQDVVTVQDIIATLDPRRLDEARVREHDTFQDQLHMADAIAITMGEQASSAQHQQAQQFIGTLWPARKWVYTVEEGVLPVSLILDSGQARQQDQPAMPAEHQALAASPSLEGAFFDFPPPPGQPQQQTATALGYTSTGLRWHPTERFDLDHLAHCVGELPATARVKGVFHTTDGWKRLNRADGALSVASSAWRQDSRLEVITPESFEHAALIAALLIKLHASRVGLS